MEMPPDEMLVAKYGKRLVYTPMCDPDFRVMTVEEMRVAWLRDQDRIIKQVECGKRKNEEFQTRMREANEGYDAIKNLED